VSIRPAFRRRLAPIAGLLAAVGLLTIAPGLAHPSAAQASVTAGELVFEQVHNGESDLTLLNTSSHAETTLSSGSFDQFPEVSPAGSKVAYSSYPLTGNEYDAIWTMNSDGSGKTQLTFPDYSGNDPSSNFTDWFPRWSPTGAQLTFTRINNYTSTDDIMVMNADGTGVTDLTPNTPAASSYYNPAWSPNGTQIAFTEQSAGVNQVMLMNSNGSNLHLIDTGTGCSDWNPEWSPDGTRIYITHQCGGTGYIDYLTSADSFGLASDSTLHQLVSGVTDLNVRVSADGSTAYYDTNSKLYSANTSTGATKLVQDDTSFAGDIDPTPVKAAWPNSATKTIVALGDSVAAGEGINYGWTWNGSAWTGGISDPSGASWANTTTALGANFQQCHQSGMGYPNLLYTDGGNYNVLNMACTGASAEQNSGLNTGGVLNPETFDTNGQPFPESTGTTENTALTVPQQLGGTCSGCSSLSAQFNKNNPTVVLLTMGANDVDFAYWIRQCYNFPGPACNTTANQNQLNSQLTIEKSELTTTLSQLNSWAASKGSSKLRVLVTNYYDPMDANNASCVDYQRWSVLTLLTGGEIAFLQGGLNSLNGNINADVNTAKTADTHLTTSMVDLSALFQNGTTSNPGSHAWCTSDPWAYGPSIDYGQWPNGPYNPAPFHPTPEGQHAIEQTVQTALGG
jgi:Tol biopolymer transport system component